MTTIEAPEIEYPEDFGQLEWKALPTGATSSPLTGVIGHDDTEGTVTALIAVSGVSDKVGDVIVPGSLAVAVARLKPKGVLDHNWGQTVSKLVFAEELMPGDPRLPKTTPNGDPWPVNAGGLLIKAKYNLDKQLGRDAYADAKFYGPELCFSIGYKVRPGGARMRGGKRHLHNYDIYEYSHVLHGAHELATLVGVKSLTDGLEWYPGGRSGPSDEGTIEVKGLPGRRIVRNAQFWGLPVGTPIRSGMHPRSTDRPATPEEIAATTAPAADTHPAGNTGAAPGGLPETPSETPGAPKPAAPGQPGKPGDVVAPALPAPPAPNVAKALAALHARYQEFAEQQHSVSNIHVGAMAATSMSMLAQFAAPGADVHASPDGQLAAVNNGGGWVMVDTANAGNLPVPIGDFPPEQIDNALAELESLDIPWDDPAARKKRWADPAAKEQDRHAVQEVLGRLTPFDVAGLGNDPQMARRDAEDAITAGDRNDLADALERMGLPPDQDPHDVAATLLVLPTEVVGKRLDAIEAAAAPPVTASMADQEGAIPVAGERALGDAATLTGDRNRIKPTKSSYVPVGNMSTAHTLDDNQLQAEHDHAVQQHLNARANRLPRNSVEFTDSRTAMRVFGDEQRRRGAAKAQADAETPLPAEAGVPNVAALRAMPHEEFQRVMVGMPPEARKEVLAKLGVDEIESLLEPSFLGGDATYREQVTDRLHEIDPTRGAGPRRAHRDLVKQEAAAKPKPEAAKTDTPKAPESAPDVTYDAHGVSEGPDGELALDEETYARQDRVLALIEAGDAALKAKSDDELTSDRKDLVGELGLQDEIAKRAASLREAAAPTRTVPSDIPAGAADDGADSVEQPAVPKVRPGLAGAAEDLGDALNATPRDEAAIAVAAERFAKLVRRAPADSKAFIELQKVIGEDIHAAIARGDLKAGMLFTAAAALREERRNTRNAAARERRKARRIDRDRIKALIGAIDAELRSRKTDATLDDGAVGDTPGSDVPGASASTTAPPRKPLTPAEIHRVIDESGRPSLQDGHLDARRDAAEAAYSGHRLKLRKALRGMGIDSETPEADRHAWETRLLNATDDDAVEAILSEIDARRDSETDWRLPATPPTPREAAEQALGDRNRGDLARALTALGVRGNREAADELLAQSYNDALRDLRSLADAHDESAGYDAGSSPHSARSRAQSRQEEGGTHGGSERRNTAADRAGGGSAGGSGQTGGGLPGEGGPADGGALLSGGDGAGGDANTPTTGPAGDGLPADGAGDTGGSGAGSGDAGVQRRAGRAGATDQGRGDSGDAGVTPEAGAPDVVTTGDREAATAADGDSVPEGTPELPNEQPLPDRGQLDAIPDTGESFRPSGVDDFAPAGKIAKLKANIAALRVLRQLQAEHRPATEDEQRVLARWAGWGGLPEVFDEHKADYDSYRDELRGLLDEKEWAEARRNTLNAHYTSATAVQAIWTAVHELGFDGGRALEPGSGSGTFIGFAPENADMVGVELDSTTAAISRALYPHATIRNESFADTRAPAGSFDLTIGNVPFGDFALQDRIHNPGRRESIHNHFILKSLALTKPGGICAVLTSRYTLDSQGEGARRRMAEMGDLIGAVRLPTGSHSKVSGTDVIEDILIFRRREPGAKPLVSDDWVHADKRDINGHRITYSRYFTDHPDQVLGEVTAEAGEYGTGSLIVKGDKTLDDLPAALARITDAARENGITANPRMEDLAELTNPADSRHDGHIAAEPDGTFTQATEGTAVPFAVPTTQAEELRGLIGMRDTLSELLAAETASLADTKQIRDLRRALNDQYDAYVARYGPINRYTLSKTGARNTPGQGGFRRDPMSAIVRALEAYDPETSTGVKTDIFRKRAVSPREIPTHADTPEDALALCMDTYGEVRLDAIARMLDIDESAARARLGDLVFEQPPLTEAEQNAAFKAHIEAAASVGLQTESRFGGQRDGLEAPDTTDLDTVGESVRQAGRLEPAAAYLSGNVRRKLAAAREAAKHDARFQPNVDALTAAVPPDLGMDEVDGRLGAAWIPAEDVQKFLQDLIYEDEGDQYSSIKVHTSGGGIWTVTGGDWGKRATEQWGTSRVSAGQLVLALLEQRSIRVTDTIDKKSYPNLEETTAAQAKAEEIQERFAEWLWEDSDRAKRLLANYNNQFNAIKLRSYDNIPRTFPGMADTFEPFDHQVAAVNRMVAEPCALLAHVVGAGKTAEMAMGTAELKRLGLAKKPAIVVPNHMLEQFSREYLEIYPNAKILAAGSDDLKGDKRREFVARAATGEWDCVILTQEAMALIPMGREQMSAYIGREMAIMKAQLAAIKAEAFGNAEKEKTTKKIENAVIKAEEALKAKLDKVKDAGVTFEQTGVDYVCVDEADKYSNLRTISNIQGAGATGSDKATDLHMKLEYLRANNTSGRVATFATGTPIRNTVTQAYIMQRYLDPQTLREAGIHSFDQWAATFGQTVDEMELKPEGAGFRQTTRFAKFRNVPELLRLFHLFADVKMADDLNLKTPDLATGAVQNVVVPASAELRAYITQLGERADDVRKGLVEPEIDNMLKISGDGRKAALSMRLVGGDHQPGKIEAAAENIAKIWEANKDRPVPRDINDPAGGDDPPPGGMQIVFCDMGTPGSGKKWSAYDELRDQLVERGLERNSIRFMHEARNDREKAELFAAARNGQVSVLIGSTERMGVGTNVQRRAVALHHLDAPWRPSDVEQRDGRIMRQGNTNAEVAIFRYVTEGSFDAYMWQTLERKKKFIDQIMRGQLGDVRELEDVGDTALSYAEVKALATGNPLLLRKAKVDTVAGKLGRLERQHARTQTNLRRDTAAYGPLAAGADTDADTYDAAIAKRTNTTSGEGFALITHGIKHTSRSEAADALKGAIQDRVQAVRYGRDYERVPTPKYLATFGGHDLMGLTEQFVDKYGNTTYGMSLTWDGIPGTITTLSPTAIRDMGPGILTTLHNNLTGFESRRDLQRDRAQHLRDEIEVMKGRIGLPFAKADELATARAESARLQDEMQRAGVSADTAPAGPAMSADLATARNRAATKLQHMGRGDAGPNKERLKKFANPAASGKVYASPDGILAAMGTGKTLQVFMTSDGNLVPRPDGLPAGVVDDPQALLNGLAALELPWDEGQWRLNQRYHGHSYTPEDYSKSYEEREAARQAVRAKRDQLKAADDAAIAAVWAKHLRAPDSEPERTGMDKAKENAAVAAEELGAGNGRDMMKRFLRSSARIPTYASDDGEIGAVTATDGQVQYFATGNGMLLNAPGSDAPLDDYAAVAQELAALDIPLGDNTARRARWADLGQREADLAAITAVYQRHRATEGKGLHVPDMIIPAAVLERASEIKKVTPPDAPDDDESFEDVVDRDDHYVMDGGGVMLKAIPCQNCGNTTQYPVGAELESRKCLMCGATLQMQPTPATVG